MGRFNTIQIRTKWFLIWIRISILGSVTCTLRKVERECLENFEMCLGKIGTIKCMDMVRNEEVLGRVDEKRAF